MSFQIDILPKSNWRKYSCSKFEFFYSGYLTNSEIEKTLNGILHKPSYEIALKNFFMSIDGCFASIISIDNNLFAYADQISSIQIYYSLVGGALTVSNSPKMILEKLSISERLLDKDAVLEIALSGFAINNKTIFKNIRKLNAGELLTFKESKLNKQRYFSYFQQREIKDEEFLHTRFKEIIIKKFSQLKNDLKGKNILVPLSGGHDSRLIAAGLKYVGTENVICFTYGKSNSAEVVVAKKVAIKLRYEWIHIPLSRKIQRDFFKTKTFKDFENYSDTFSGVQFIQDICAISKLKELRSNKNDVIVNGNTGDFISGAHIPRKTRHKTYEDFFIEKHYGLWDSLANEKNMEYVRKELKKSLELITRNKQTVFNDFNHYEFLEWDGRQSNFIVLMQKSYEFFDYKWRMPFWEKSYIEFWQNVSLDLKLNGKLYYDSLKKINLCGVWDSEFQFREKHLVLRLIKKFLSFLFNKRLSNKISKNLLYYFMDDSGGVAIEPFYKYLFDRKGFRNRVSFRSQKYLINKKNEHIGS